MRRASTMIVAATLTATACGGGGQAEVIERRAPSGDADEISVSAEQQTCVDVEAFGLGSFAGPDFNASLDELARIAALLGATEALPHLSNMRAAFASDEPMAYSMDTAADILDEVSFDECGVPIFTAMYVTTSFASCFGRAPIAAGSMTPGTAGCETGTEPDYLPCFDATRGHIPVDCRTGTPVVVRDGEWIDS